jgi:hypothetical protein
MPWDVPLSDSRTIASTVYPFPRCRSRTCAGRVWPPKQRARSKVRFSGLQSRSRQTTQLEHPQTKLVQFQWSTNLWTIEKVLEDHNSRYQNSTFRLLGLRDNTQKIPPVWDTTGVNCTFMYGLLVASLFRTWPRFHALLEITFANSFRISCCRTHEERNNLSKF